MSVMFTDCPPIDTEIFATSIAPGFRPSPNLQDISFSKKSDFFSDKEFSKWLNNSLPQKVELAPQSNKTTFTVFDSNDFNSSLFLWHFHLVGTKSLLYLCQGNLLPSALQKHSPRGVL